MSRSLSGNILFHFTGHLDNLIGILSNGFYPRLCFEEDVDFKPADKLPDKITPMVSFCDMRLSDALKGRHTLDYGRYAVGISKSWARDQGISPVLYVPSSKSFNLQGIALIFGNLLEMSKMKTKDSALHLMRINNGIGSLSFFLKRYEGNLYKNWERGKETITFYDEREWRYVPMVVNTGKLVFLCELMKDMQLISKDIFCADETVKFVADELNLSMTNREFINRQNRELEVQALMPPGDQIRYIIVAKHSEIPLIKAEMKKIESIKDHLDTIDVFSIEDHRANIL